MSADGNILAVCFIQCIIKSEDFLGLTDSILRDSVTKNVPSFFAHSGYLMNRHKRLRELFHFLSTLFS